MLRLTVNNQHIPVQWINFSDGAVTCKINGVFNRKGSFTIAVDPSTPASQVIGELRLLTDAVVSIAGGWPTSYKLFLPYLPYARADRRFEQGNPHPLAVFLNQLATFNFDEIIVVDPHSDYYKNHFELNITVVPQHAALLSTTSLRNYDYVIAPDKGAANKIKQLSKPYILASKTRDVSTGRITETALETDKDLTGARVLIVDDILDGGGTFIPLAQRLKERGVEKVDLYVTHLIAAKGLDLFKGLINKIYTYNIVGKHTTPLDLINFNEGSK